MKQTIRTECAAAIHMATRRYDEALSPLKDQFLTGKPNWTGWNAYCEARRAAYIAYDRECRVLS